MGPVELWIDGRRCDLGTAKERCVLVALLLNPGRPVPAESLIDRVWDGDPPAKPRPSLYSYVTRLRHRFDGVDGVELKSRKGNYLIEVDEGAVDLYRFRLLRDQARAIAESGDDDYALDHYRRAVELWRGPPLGDLSGDWVARTRTRLEEELLAATLDRAEIELRCGNHSALVGELSDLAQRYPYNERPVEFLMTALYRSGRQAEALTEYRRLRARLAEDVGTDPGPDVQGLQQRILRNDPELLRTPGARPPPERPPNTLQPDAQAFTGRDEELRRLLAAVSPAEPPGSAVNVIAIDGMPGVGKSALALHLAHRLTGGYPDGQLFVGLHANDPQQEPLDPAAALDTLLRMIGVPAGRIPRTLDERAALWRSRLAHSRMIVVLDDAAGHGQVRPLLPASPGCLVIVTSRRRLAGLHDALPVPLDTLQVDDAAALFTKVAGAGRALDGAGVAEVVRRCGFLPLAVRIAASRLRHRRTWDVGDLLARLAHDDRRLAELRVEGSEITTVFETSYRGLPAPLRRAFRAFGLHPGPELTAYSAAAALRLPVHEAERALEDLHDRHLITEPARGRYRFHDLVRDYARRLAHQEDLEDERRRTNHRVLDFYLSAAGRADLLTAPRRRRIAIGVTHPPADPPPLATAAQAREWFDAEQESLLGCAAFAARHGWPGHLAPLAHVLADHLESRGAWEASARLHEQAVAAWRGLGDPLGTAQAQSDLSLICYRTGEYDAALRHAGDALVTYRSAGERHGEAELLDRMCLVLWHQSRFVEALAHCRTALAIRRSIGDQRGEAESLDHAAIFLEYTGAYREAERFRGRALAIFTELGDARGRAFVLNNAGDLALRLGQIDRAVRYYTETAAETAELGRQNTAIWLINIATVSRHTGRAEEALRGYREALSMVTELGDRRTEIEILIGIGAVFDGIGRHGEALIHYQKGLAISRAINERYEETLALRRMGEALAGSGRYTAALDRFRQAHDLARRIGVPYEVAKALEGMGTALLHSQGREAARERWTRAVAIYEQLGGDVPELPALRARLLDGDHATGS